MTERGFHHLHSFSYTKMWFIKVFWGVSTLSLLYSSVASALLPKDIRAPVTKMATGKIGFDIYLGGENFVASLSQELEVIFYISIGPVLEAENCHPLPAPCNNTVQVLEIDEAFNKLIVCGTAYGGTCTMHSIPHICEWMCVDADHTNSSQSNVISASGDNQFTTHYLSPRNVEFVLEPITPITDLPWYDCRSDTFAAQCNMFMPPGPQRTSNSINTYPQPQPYKTGKDYSNPAADASDTKPRDTREVPYADWEKSLNSEALASQHRKTRELSDTDWEKIRNSGAEAFISQPQLSPLIPITTDNVNVDDDYFGNAFESRLVVAGQREFVGVDMPLSPVISMRYITHIMDESFLLVYPGDVDRKRIPGIFVDKDKPHFKIDFKLSFTSGQFSYLVNVQRGHCPYTDKGDFQSSCSMLSRLNNSSPSLLPYIEIPLKCRYNSMDYPLLTASAFGYIGFRGASGQQKVPVLILAFGRGDGDATEPLAKYGTAICAHTIHNMDKKDFDYLQDSCERYPTWSLQPEWIMKSEDDKPCQFIQSKSFGNREGALIHIPGAIVSTLVTHTQTVRKDAEISYVDKMYVYALTTHVSTFKFSKYLELEVIKANDQYDIVGHHVMKSVIPDYQMEKQPTYPPVGKVDPSRAMLYLAYGSKVFSLSLDFCRQYTTCSSCQSQGGGQCRWCPGKDHCMESAICSTPLEGSCPPRLSSFEPRAVPISGGSTLTIRGTHLGDRSANVTVAVCGQPCDDVMANFNSLTCTVRSKPQCPPYCEDCFIRVYVSGTKESSGYDDSPSKLTYQSPELAIFQPSHGPLSGGTYLHVWGKHLLVGTSRSIEVAGVPCELLPFDRNQEEEKLTCRMTKAVGVSANQCGRVKVKIDDYEVEADHAEYCFKPDPIITSIMPPSTTESGGIKLKVRGRYFHSTTTVELLITIKHDQDKHRFMDNCTRDREGRTLECVTPNMRDVTKHMFDERPDASEIEGRFDIHIGGTVAKFASEKLFFIRHDPIIFHLVEGSSDSHIHNKLKDNLFPIAGKFIPDWLDPSAVKITIGKTRCEVVRMSKNQIFCNVSRVIEEYKKDRQGLMNTTTPLPTSTNTTETNLSSRNNVGINSTNTTPQVSRSTTVETTMASSQITTTPDVPRGIINSTLDTAGSLNTTTQPSSIKEKEKMFDEVSESRRLPSSNKAREIKLEQPLSYHMAVTIGNWKQDLGTVSVGTLASKPEGEGEDEAPFLGKNTHWFVKIIVGVIGGTVLVLLFPIIGCCLHARRKNKRLEQNIFYMGSLSGGQAGGSCNTGSAEPAVLSLTQILNSVIEPTKRDAANKYIIDQDRLALGKKIGSGNFGCVYEGMISDGKLPPRRVAVKTLQDPVSHSINLSMFVQEAIIMMDFDHENVLGLVGLAEKEAGIPYVILPYMENGDLLTYVRDPKRSLNLYDAIQFGADICNGMSYLSSLKFVHRDLAARNCMLDNNYRVKVADFGLCRDIYEKGYYTSDNKKKLPIRWMAVESIENGAYSTKSDVWSMGVVMWELLTRGMTPYPGVDGWDIINFLRRRRLAPPYYCPEYLYRLMMNCWAKDPTRRPSFKALQKELLLMIGMELVSTPNTPEAKRNLKIFPTMENKDVPKTFLINEAEDPNPYLIPRIRISQDDVGKEKEKGRRSYNKSDASLSSAGCAVAVGDDGYAHLDKNKGISGSVMSLPRSNLVKNAKILIPTCYEFRDVKKEAVATYIQIVDNYEPPPRFNNPFLRSKKKRNKSSKRSKENKISKEITSIDGGTRTSGGGRGAVESKTLSGGYSLPSPSPSPSSFKKRPQMPRPGSDGQLVDNKKSMMGSLAPFADAGDSYFLLEHDQRASQASVLAPSSCHSSVVFNKTGSLGSILDASSMVSSMGSLDSSTASFPSSRRPPSNQSAGFPIKERRPSSLQNSSPKQYDHSGRGDKTASLTRSSLRNEDVIEM